MEQTKPKRITLRNTPERPLTAEEIVNATISFANGDTLDLKDLVDPFQWSRDGIKPEVAETYVGNRELRRREERDASESGSKPRTIKQIRDQWRFSTRETLTYYLTEPLLPEDANSLINLDFFPRINGRVHFRRTATGLTLDFYYTFATGLDLVSLGELLIEDTERPFGKKLCQCQLKSCGRFFLEVKPPTGRPQRRYCCPEHLKAAHAQNAPKRMQRIRKKPKGKK
jgi:hypothetical protein